MARDASSYRSARRKTAKAGKMVWSGLQRGTRADGSLYALVPTVHASTSTKKAK